MRRLRPVFVKDAAIYGPVVSRRLGRSLGINLLGAGRKVCTFDCVYCQLRQPRAYKVADGGEDAVCRRLCATCQYAQPLPPSLATPHEFPAVDDLLAAVADAMRSAPALDSLTLSGNGEPTVYPQFADVIDGLSRLRNALCPGTRITVLSNSSTLWRTDVREALGRVDVRVMKLDAGDAATFRRYNRPCPGVELEHVLEGLRSIGPMTLQTLFAAGPAGNAAPEQVEAWLRAVERVRPTEMQVYSLDRIPAENHLAVLPRERLEEIAGEAATRTGADVRVF